MTSLQINNCGICKDPINELMKYEDYQIIKKKDKLNGNLKRTVKWLPCDHGFHRECIKNWFNACTTDSNDLTCPNCRFVVKEKEPWKPTPDTSTQLFFEHFHISLLDLLSSDNEPLRNNSLLNESLRDNSLLNECVSNFEKMKAVQKFVLEALEHNKDELENLVLPAPVIQHTSIFNSQETVEENKEEPKIEERKIKEEKKVDSEFEEVD